MFSNPIGISNNYNKPQEFPAIDGHRPKFDARMLITPKDNQFHKAMSSNLDPEEEDGEIDAALDATEGFS